MPILIAPSAKMTKVVVAASYADVVFMLGDIAPVNLGDITL